MVYPSLKINLDGPYDRRRIKAHTFIPGDQVPGKVVFRPEEDVQVDSIVIQLKGKCKTRVKSGRDTRIFELRIFTMRKTLFQGPFKMRADTYEYPFSFIFPERFDYKCSLFHQDRLFANNGLLPLPPSCNDSGGFGSESSIRYSISVKIPRTFGSWKDKILLHFTPVRIEANPAPLPKTAKDYQPLRASYRLTEEGQTRALTRKESLKDTFRKKIDTQVINFKVSAEAPTAIVLGKPYTIKLTVHTDATDNIVPEFYLREFRAHLKAMTFIRAPGSFGHHTGNNDYHIPLGSRANAKLPIALNTDINLQGLYPSKIAAEPTFSSFAMRRTYGMTLHVTIACLDEEFKAVMKWPSVMIYSARMDAGVEEMLDAVQSGALDLNEDEHQLPLYEPPASASEPAPPQYEPRAHEVSDVP